MTIRTGPRRRFAAGQAHSDRAHVRRSKSRGNDAADRSAAAFALGLPSASRRQAHVPSGRDRLHVRFDRGRWYGGVVTNARTSRNKAEVRFDDGDTGTVGFEDDDVIWAVSGAPDTDKGREALYQQRLRPAAVGVPLATKRCDAGHVNSASAGWCVFPGCMLPALACSASAPPLPPRPPTPAARASSAKDAQAAAERKRKREAEEEEVAAAAKAQEEEEALQLRARIRAAAAKLAAAVATTAQKEAAAKAHEKAGKAQEQSAAAAASESAQAPPLPLRPALAPAPPRQATTQPNLSDDEPGDFDLEEVTVEPTGERARDTLQLLRSIQIKYLFFKTKIVSRYGACDRRGDWRGRGDYPQSRVEARTAAYRSPGQFGDAAHLGPRHSLPCVRLGHTACNRSCRDPSAAPQASRPTRRAPRPVTPRRGQTDHVGRAAPHVR